VLSAPIQEGKLALRVIRTDSWKEVSDRTGVPLFNITEFHKIPDGITCIMTTGDNTLSHIGNAIQSKAEGKRKLPYISNMEFPDSLIYATNASIWHENVVPIPLGCLTFDDSMVKEDQFGQSKRILCYANFTEWCGRDVAVQALKHRDFITWERYSGEDAQASYINDLCDSNFVICPFGNGYDSYRVWESLYCGAIPIVPRCVLFERFEKLPLIMIDDWSLLSLDLIQSKYDDLKARGGCYDQADLDYWEKRIADSACMRNT
jgi:hypothetical protein